MPDAKLRFVWYVRRDEGGVTVEHGWATGTAEDGVILDSRGGRCPLFFNFADAFRAAKKEAGWE